MESAAPPNELLAPRHLLLYMITREDLSAGWSVRAEGSTVPPAIAGTWVPTSVPASGHSALICAGLIADPYKGANETELVWAHHARWLFRRNIVVAERTPDERVDLVFDGLDTFADIRVDGTSVRQSANMHRVIRVPLEPGLTQNHELEIEFTPALEVARKEHDRLGSRPAAYPHPYYMVRKMAASFGWDWGPDLQASGIWRAARLERWSVARLSTVRPVITQIDSTRWKIDVHVEIERATPGRSLHLRADLNGTDVADSIEVELTGSTTATTISFEVTDPPLWQPHDRGSQNLASLVVHLGSAHEWFEKSEKPIGFRSVTIDQTADEHGTSFVIVINGEKIFARGFNWIPDDHLVDRITPAQLRQRLTQARDAHANLIRVWGGGVYESDAFYDICDELGLLVWQDIALACAGYPESEPLRSEILSEVEENAQRLSHHPSLIIWCGGNENAWGFPQWKERGDIDDVTDWGARYIYEWLPELLARVDPTRAYVSNSPFSPADGDFERWPNDPDHGLFHEWDVWNKLDYTKYSAVIPRFCAEFGYQGPPNRGVLDSSFSASGLRALPGDSAFELHQKAENGNAKLANGMAPHLGSFDDLANWHAATQIMQAIAIRSAIEHYRAHWPRTAGAIVWQLNDCWPAVSWSAIDSAGAPKPVWHAIRRAFSDRLANFTFEQGTGIVTLINDSAAEWRTPLAVRRETLSGNLIEKTRWDATVAARSTARFTLPHGLSSLDNTGDEIVVVNTDLGDCPFLLAEPVEVNWLPDSIKTKFAPHPEGWEIEVTALSAVFGLTVMADLVDPAGRVDDSMIDLPAGAVKTFVVSTVHRADPHVFTSADAVRHIGELVSKRNQPQGLQRNG